MWDIVIIAVLLLILIVVAWPRRRSPYVRDITKNMNGQPHWRDKEPY